MKIFAKAENAGRSQQGATPMETSSPGSLHSLAQAISLFPVCQPAKSRDAPQNDAGHRAGKAACAQKTFG
jgi:hypothetical protein